jgi:hypothetical protein
MARAKAMAARVESLRATLQILSEHDPPWSDDFLRARAALHGTDPGKTPVQS